MKKQKSSKKIVHKTNAMRILDKFKLQYECISYSDISAVSGRSVADALLENPNQVFKTLVAQGHSKKYYVFMITIYSSVTMKKRRAFKEILRVYDPCYQTSEFKVSGEDNR